MERQHAPGSRGRYGHFMQYTRRATARDDMVYFKLTHMPKHSSRSSPYSPRSA